MEKIVNNNINGYNEVRNIIGENAVDYQYKRDLFSFLSKLVHRVFKMGYVQELKGFYYHPFSKNNKHHFFNSINLGRGKWTVTFETLLPRLGKYPKIFYKIAINRLAHQDCIKVIALSQNAYKNQVDFLRLNYPKQATAIIVKMEVRLPPQRVIINDYSKKILPKDFVVFTIVGSDFFRKGGEEVVMAFDELIPRYKNLKLIIISSLQYGDYASKKNKKDYLKVLRIIEKNRENIKHYNSLKNSEVLDVFKNTHVGLLPTWADSFGYSILEAQACGCPVVTTDIRAIPEINNNEIGWVIEVPKGKNNDAELTTAAARSDFSALLERELKRIIIEILKDKDSIKIKGEKALQNITKNH
jgi:glycosyltransferase involved in cell wall biosynthesis